MATSFEAAGGCGRRRVELLRHVGGRRELPREIADRGGVEEVEDRQLDADLARDRGDGASTRERGIARRGRRSCRWAPPPPSRAARTTRAAGAPRARAPGRPTRRAPAPPRRRPPPPPRRRAAAAASGRGGLAVELLGLSGADGEGGSDHPVLRHRVRRQLTACGVAQRAEPTALVGRRRRRRRRVRENMGNERGRLRRLRVEERDDGGARDAGQRADRRLDVGEPHLEASDLDDRVDAAEHLQLAARQQPRQVARPVHERRRLLRRRRFRLLRLLRRLTARRRRGARGGERGRAVVEAEGGAQLGRDGERRAPSAPARAYQPREHHRRPHEERIARRAVRHDAPPADVVVAFLSGTGRRTNAAPAAGVPTARSARPGGAARRGDGRGWGVVEGGVCDVGAFPRRIVVDEGGVRQRGGGGARGPSAPPRRTGPASSGGGRRAAARRRRRRRRLASR